MLTRGLILALVLGCGCKSQPPAKAVTPRRDEVRQDPMPVIEVQTKVRALANDFADCYRIERRQLVMNDLSDYVLQLRVPTDGKPPEVTVVKASIAGQGTLEECVVRVLARLRFPAHPGERITLNVPIEAPK